MEVKSLFLKNLIFYLHCLNPGCDDHHLDKEGGRQCEVQTEGEEHGARFEQKDAEHNDSSEELLPVT